VEPVARDGGGAGDVTEPLLAIDHLTAELPVEGQMQTVLRDVSLIVEAGEAVGLVGESGSGKSMTARAVARLLPDGARTGGAIRFAGADVTALTGGGLRAYRGEVAMIFQDPRVHINPVRSIGDFLCEVLRTNRGVSRAHARRQAVAGLADVGIDDGQRRLGQYPHELSGGLLQRVMIAAVLLTEPRLVLADEPTTALDVTTQAEVMAILDELRHERGLAMLFITHDLDLAAAVCDRTAVMYAGEIVESQASTSLTAQPRHPYTASLAGARPRIDSTTRRLAAIRGRPVSAFEAPDGCAFAPRCDHCEPRCRDRRPELVPGDGGVVRCLRADELGSTLAAGAHGG
jgi:oligopeptide/dipeptide ABC transporter ATP-binding protein